MEFTTSRLILRPWKVSDAADLYRYAKDPRVGPIAGWPPHTSVQNSLEIIQTVLSKPETYAVTLRATGRPVGCCGLLFGTNASAPLQPGEAEIGYWLGVPYWGQGLIPEAVERIMEHCFTQLGCNAVWCGYYEGNDNSRRVQEKCGMRYHHSEQNKLSPLGDLRTEHFSCLTKAQWANRNKLQPLA